jgi:hypothetical protein
MLIQEQVIQDVIAERNRQDDEFGGAPHNDLHTPAEWIAMTVKQLGKSVAHCNQHGDGEASKEYRQRLINAAALLVAAVESYDRVGVVQG